MRLNLPALLLATAALALGVSACGGDDSSSGQSAAPKPVAKVDQLSGQSTAVTLDAGCVRARTTGKLTAEAAQLHNQTCGVDALKLGLVIGVAKITIDTAA